MDSKKESIRRVKSPSKFEIETLKDIARDNDCSMEQLIDCIMSNFVRAAISFQVNSTLTKRRSYENR